MDPEKTQDPPASLHDEGDNMFTNALEQFMEEEGDKLDFSHKEPETFEVDDDDAPPAPAEEVKAEDDEVVEPEDIKAELEAELKTEEPKAEVDDKSFEDLLKAEIKELYDDPKPGVKFASLKREVKDLKAEMERLRTETPETDEVVQLRAQAAASSNIQADLDAARQRLNLIDYESTPEYEQQIIEPFNELSTAAKHIDAANGLEEGTTLAAISHKDRVTQDNMVAGIVNQLSIRDQTRIYSLADNFLMLDQKASVAREHAAERLGQYQEQSTTEQSQIAERNRVEYQRDVGNIFDKYDGRLPGFVSDDGVTTESYNTAKAAAAGTDFATMNNQEKALASFSAHVLPEALSQLQAMQSQIIQLKQQNAELTVAKPNLNSGKVAPTRAKATPVSLYEADDDDIRFG